jgi:hypothetical protein
MPISFPSSRSFFHLNGNAFHLFLGKAGALVARKSLSAELQYDSGHENMPPNGFCRGLSVYLRAKTSLS